MVLPRGDQKLAGGVGADAMDGHQLGVDGGDQGLQQFVEVGDLGGELLVTTGEGP
ncbi:hypothetical protein [Nonomuraea dietziae]|uniref:hypothetical protein n=1 Tax=Nonomuraea dietziae TaxID=65515 RepID=UPI0031CE8CBD